MNLSDLMPDAKDVYVGKGITVYDVKQRLRKLEAVRENIKALPELAIETAEWGGGGYKVVPAEGYESRTFVDYEALQEALADCGDES